MSRESLSKAVQFAGGQAPLAAAIKEFLGPDCKVAQAYISQWLNPEKVKCEVPPPEYVIAIAQAINYQVTPHDLRPDIYPHQDDGMPHSLRACCDHREAA